MVKRNYKVIWEDSAKASLRSIYNYIKKRESEDQAKKVRDVIRDLARSLGFMPHKYVEDPFLKKNPEISVLKSSGITSLFMKPPKKKLLSSMFIIPAEIPKT